MVKKRNPRSTAPAAPAAPVRRRRQSSWITRKAGTPSPQTAAQPVSLPPGSPAWLDNAGTYSTGRRRKKAGADVAVPQVPQFPQLGTAATAYPNLIPAPGSALVPVTVAVPAKRPGDATAAAVKTVKRLAWRYRWQLTPAAASLGTALGAGVSPVMTVLGLGAVAGAGYLTAAKGPDQLGGRVWLSRAERTVMGRWGTGAAVWAAGIGVANASGINWTGAGVAVAVGALAALTGAPVVSWLKSRAVRTAEIVDAAEPLSPAALQLVAAWPLAVAFNAPEGLAGSAIVDLTEPAPGTLVAVVQLRADVHAEDVANAGTRKWLERALHMGVGTAKVELIRDHAGQVRIILTPSRQLEKVSKDWPGPVVYDDGRMPIAVTPDGREVCIEVYGEDGVRHLALIGSSKSGKSNAYNVLLLPMVILRKSVLIYVDGKGGTSSPGLARAMAMVAREPHEWAPAIRMVHRIVMSRQKRYGAMGLDTFDVNGPDPIIDLVLDEGSSIARKLNAEETEMLVEIAERGRSLGVSLKIGLQTPNADEFPGGMPVRNNLMGANGNVVGLRPGGNSAKNVTLSATSAEIDLLGLPGGGGWCAVLVCGDVEADKSRVLWMRKGAADEHLDAGFIPRGLTGADAVAAGETWEKRTTGAEWADSAAKLRAAWEAGQSVTIPADVAQAPAEPVAAERVDQVDDVAPSPAALVSQAAGNLLGKLAKEQGEETKRNLLDALAKAGRNGASRAELEERTGLATATVNRHVAALVTDGRATRDQDNRIHLAADRVAA